MTSILLVAGATLCASFLCSLLEAALYALTPTQVELIRQRGASGGARLAALRADVEAPIAAILTVNTIAHTLGAAWCGAMVGEHFGNTAVGVFAAVFTVLVLALTEILPKSLGVRYAVGLAPLIVWPLQVMIWTVWPIVWLAQRAMGWITGGKTASGPSEEEIRVYARLAARHGEVRKEEQRWVENALRLDRVTAGDLRTPRTVVETLPAATRVADITPHAQNWSYSRVPVTEGDDIDAVIGLVYRRDVFDAALAGEDATTLRQLMRPIRFVPESMPAHALLNLFLKERVHLVAITDEHGGFEGVCTLEDVLECMLGVEIVDEHDRHEDMQVEARRRLRHRTGSIAPGGGPDSA